jgi:site-specific DNA-methyltransferase (adenine-specific)
MENTKYIYSAQELLNKNLVELKKICKENKIPNYSKCKKNEIIDKILCINQNKTIKEPNNNITNTNLNKYIVENIDAIEFVNKCDDNSIDLILTDPPYIISKDTGMNTHYNKCEKLDENCKTEKEWNDYCKENDIDINDNSNETYKNNYIKYGTIYGKKYCIQTDYGDWDQEFTIEYLEKIIELLYKKLKNGGTMIMFFDLWKITILKDILDKYKFKQIRMIEWIKTNAVPINSNINYLSNAREIALVAIKGSKPTFHSKYDKGIYEYPIQSGKIRFHPTQKNLELIKELINKHSNENDIVLCFHFFFSYFFSLFLYFGDFL